MQRCMRAPYLVGWSARQARLENNSEEVAYDVSGAANEMFEKKHSVDKTSPL
jgi:hypothetical protein